MNWRHRLRPARIDWDGYVRTVEAVRRAQWQVAGIARTLVDAADEADRHPAPSAALAAGLRGRPRRGGRRDLALRGVDRRARRAAVEQHVGRALELLDDDERGGAAHPAGRPSRVAGVRGPRARGRAAGPELRDEQRRGVGAHGHRADPDAARREPCPRWGSSSSRCRRVGEQLPADHRAGVGAEPATPAGHRHRRRSRTRPAPTSTGSSTPVVTATPSSSSAPPAASQRSGPRPARATRWSAPRPARASCRARPRPPGAGRAGCSRCRSRRARPATRCTRVESTRGHGEVGQGVGHGIRPVDDRERARRGSGTTSADQTVIDRPAPKPLGRGRRAARRDGPGAGPRRGGRRRCRPPTRWPRRRRAPAPAPGRDRRAPPRRRRGPPRRRAPRRPGAAGPLAQRERRDHDGEAHLGLEHERGETGRHPDGEGGVEQGELAQAHEQPRRPRRRATAPAGAARARSPGRARRRSGAATNRVGGRSPSPRSMTTKLAPQITATRTARATWRGGTPSILAR